MVPSNRTTGVLDMFYSNYTYIAYISREKSGKNEERNKNTFVSPLSERFLNASLRHSCALTSRNGSEHMVDGNYAKPSLVDYTPPPRVSRTRCEIFSTFFSPCVTQAVRFGLKRHPPRTVSFPRALQKDGVVSAKGVFDTPYST